MLPHATRKDPRLQHSNEQLGHAIAIMPARIEKNKNFMNVTNRVLQCCALVKNHGRKNAKLAWTTPFVPDTFIVPSVAAVRARRREVRSGARQEVFSLALWQETGDLPLPDIGSSS